jgi:hypothetical protein
MVSITSLKGVIFDGLVYFMVLFSNARSNNFMVCKN